jgi:hypothetical protein
MGHWVDDAAAAIFRAPRVETMDTGRGGARVELHIDSATLNDIVRKRGLEGLLEIAEDIATVAAFKAPVDNTASGARRRKRQRRNHLNKRIKARQTLRATFVSSRFPTTFVERGHDVKNRKGGPVLGKAEPKPFLMPSVEGAIANAEAKFRNRL